MRTFDLGAQKGVQNTYHGLALAYEPVVVKENWNAHCKFPNEQPLEVELVNVV